MGQTIDTKTSAEIAKGLINIARKNELSIAKVNEMYNAFNKRTYNNYFKKGGQFRMYIPELQDKALKLTEKYFGIQKVREA